MAKRIIDRQAPVIEVWREELKENPKPIGSYLFSYNSLPVHDFWATLILPYSSDLESAKIFAISNYFVLRQRIWGAR